MVYVLIITVATVFVSVGIITVLVMTLIAVQELLTDDITIKQ